MATIRVPGDLIIEEDTRLPHWLDLTIIGGRIDAQAFQHVLLDGAVQQIVAYQYQNSAVLSFRIEPGYRYDTMRSTSSGWLMVLFRREMPLPSPLAQVGELVEIDREQWSINTIVIDPGHGGRDPGAVCDDNVYEKDIVLNIANRLARMLESELDVNVVQTRSTDQFVSLRERGRIATQNGGKLFISIHANTNPDSRISGVETYFLSEAQTDEARQVARLENAAMRYEHTDEPVDGAPYSDWYAWQDVDEILAGMTSTRFLTESQELAKLVQDELARTLGARDLGVRQAEFYVMKGTLASMPSILVEVGFLSNPAEARHLRQAAYQRRAADAIFRAVREFKQRYERNL
ncbi:MAG TPA: N-acetylmuramoyl-L-alanine amidase [Firmicutes bacterium]|nr:N-acetylmuramoyl-L-alanine amidase [Bacillota bacterium]